MPLSNETLQNKVLSGPELLEIILKDARSLLAKDGMFSAHVGYGRVGYSIRVELEMDNLTYPTHVAQRREGFPLPKPSDEAVAVDLARSREIKSPNAARVLNDLPITVQTVQGGKLVSHEVQGYDKSEVPPQPAHVDQDRSKEAYAKLRQRTTPKGA